MFGFPFSRPEPNDTWPTPIPPTQAPIRPGPSQADREWWERRQARIRVRLGLDADSLANENPSAA